MKEVIKTLDPRKNRLVRAGIFDDKTKTFTKRVKPEKHLMRKFNAYGIQEDIFNQLVSKGCKSICIQTPEGNLYSEVLSWLSPSIKVMDFNSGKQRFYPVDRMNFVEKTLSQEKKEGKRKTLAEENPFNDNLF